MKKTWMVAAVLAVALTAAGCTPEKEGPPGPDGPHAGPEEPEEAPRISPETGENLQVMGFDAEGRILAASSGTPEGSVLYAVDSGKGTAEEVVRTELMITEAESHPSGRLLLRLEAGEGEAHLRLIGAGTAEEDLIVESHDIAWSWNPDDWTELYITAFDENWEYDVFLADASSGSLEEVEDAGPFPVWTEAGGVVEILDDGNLGDGGTLVDGSGKAISENVLEFSTDGMMFAIAKASGDGSIDYMIGSGNGDWMPVLTLPAGEQWLGLLPAKILPAGPGQFATLLPAETDAVAGVSKWQPAVISKRGILKSSAMVDSPVMTCSPEASVCLSGAMGEMLFDLADGTVVNWMEQLKGDSGK
ncbi:hypothetical protein AV656_02255 [Bhargavaea cecembensis]|uniref:YqgU-like 6-bladed beta-propeller domain-containing protein n=1 Tax=Bhargavaea cecembensis TaxID=394098 RepID=A0A165HIN6_9BACL|nr:hypothetical protein [Bhargavaea cecembensis]KZE40118.1 hypothetical protein AV656_02255 [Bhargavaea cecembensis]